MDNRIVIRGNKLTESMIAEASEWNVRYKTGDDVHRNGPVVGYHAHSGSPIHKPIYGKVDNHSNASFHVKWEDGTETTHRHDGDVRGHHSSKYSIHASPSHASHVTGHDEKGNYGRKISPEEHKKQHEAYVGQQAAIRNHQDNVKSTKEKLGSLHHTQISPEHAAKLKSLVDEIHAAHVAKSAAK